MDVWSSLDSLVEILDKHRPASREWSAWKIAKDTRIVLMGHSNGGQGAWHISGRYPDRVIAGFVFPYFALFTVDKNHSCACRCLYQVSSLCSFNAIEVSFTVQIKRVPDLALKVISLRRPHVAFCFRILFDPR